MYAKQRSSNRMLRSRITTVKVSPQTKVRLDYLRLYPRETYDDIMQRILEMLNLCRIDPERAQARLIEVDKERKRNMKSAASRPKEEYHASLREKAF